MLVNLSGTITSLLSSSLANDDVSNNVACSDLALSTKTDEAVLPVFNSHSTRNCQLTTPLKSILSSHLPAKSLSWESLFRLFIPIRPCTSVLKASSPFPSSYPSLFLYLFLTHWLRILSLAPEHIASNKEIRTLKHPRIYKFTGQSTLFRKQGKEPERR